MTQRKHFFRPVAWLAALILPLAALAQGQAPETAGGPAQTEAASEQQPSLPELHRRVQEAFQAEDYDTAVRNLQRMRAQLPFDGKLLYELAATYALKGDPQRAFNTLVRLQQQGLAYSPRGDKRFQDLEQYQLFDHLSKLLDQNGEPFNQAELAVRGDTDLKWPHAIAHLGPEGGFLVAGIGQGRILRVRSGGKSEVFFDGDEGPAGITALKVDSERDVVWAAGTEVRDGEQGLSINVDATALYRFGLESGELQSSLPIAEGKDEPHLFNEIAVGPDGRIYAADALSPLVYSAKPGDDSLKAMFGDLKLSGFHGVSVTPDGKYLFVSDWVTGIYRVELASGTARRLTSDPTVNLGGIHSMTFRDGELFVVQTGTRPERVARIQLSESLHKAVAMFPLSANEAEYDRLGLGVLTDDGYYFLANSGWSLTGKPALESAAPVVLKADTDLGRDRPTPNEMPEWHSGDAVPGQTPPSMDESGASSQDQDG